MKIRLQQGCWLTFIEAKQNLRLIGAVLSLLAIAAPLQGEEQTTLNRWNIDSRLRLPLAEQHDTQSELAGSESIDLDVLRLGGSFTRNDDFGLAIQIELDLAGRTELAECKRHIQNEVKQQRCRTYPLRRFSVLSRPHDAMTLELGQFPMPQDGWNGYESAPLVFLETMNFDGPFEESQPAARLTLGEFSVIATNDVSTSFPSVGEFTYTRTQPVFLLEWKQANCQWCGLVQVGDYDMNHSQFLNVGLHGEEASFRGFIDAGVDARDRKYLFDKRRSMRWHGTLQVEYAFTEVHAVRVSAAGFRMFARGLPGDAEVANKPGEVDQNLLQASGAYLWTLPNHAWRYFVDVRGNAASFYELYPAGPQALKRQMSVECGVITLLSHSSHSI